MTCTNLFSFSDEDTEDNRTPFQLSCDLPLSISEDDDAGLEGRVCTHISYIQQIITHLIACY